MIDPRRAEILIGKDGVETIARFYELPEVDSLFRVVNYIRVPTQEVLASGPICPGASYILSKTACLQAQRELEKCGIVPDIAATQPINETAAQSVLGFFKDW
jgi:hypothetical protein